MSETKMKFDIAVAERYIEEINRYRRFLFEHYKTEQIGIIEDLVYSYIPSVLSNKKVFGETLIPTWVWLETLEETTKKVKQLKRLHKNWKKIKKQRKHFYKELKEDISAGLPICGNDRDKLDYYEIAVQNAYRSYQSNGYEIAHNLVDMLEEIIETLTNKLNEETEDTD